MEISKSVFRKPALLIVIVFFLIANNAFAAGGGTLELSIVIAVLAVFLFLALIMGEQAVKLAATRMLGDKASASNLSLLPSSEELVGNKAHPIAGKNKVVKLKQGFDIKLEGEAEKYFNRSFSSSTFAVKPTDWNNLQPIPKMMVEVGDSVKAGDKLFYDRKLDNFFFTAPVSGEVIEIKRGAKRAITEVVILADSTQEYKSFKVANPKDLSSEAVKEQIREGGAWVLLNQRPFGVPANPEVRPKAIHISCFDSAPLAIDYNWVFNRVNQADFQAGLDALNKLTDGKVHLNLNAKSKVNPVFANASNVQHNYFEGKHPAGVVGIQIHHVDPINKGDIVWTVKPEDVVTIGKLFTKGKYEPVKYVAVAGAELEKTFYLETKLGANVSKALENNLTNDNVRVLSGNVLTGTIIEQDGYIGVFDNLVTVLEEGNQHEMFGWLLPSYARPSISPTIPWSLMPFAKFKANTNTHGEKRAFVVTGQYDEVLPMDLYPQQLLKAIIANDFDLIEGLGIYEVIEEDLAICEFVCTSKQPVQKILREGLDYIESQS